MSVEPEPRYSRYRLAYPFAWSAWVPAHEEHTLRPARPARPGRGVAPLRSGKVWRALSVGVGEGDAVTWVLVAIFEEKGLALAGLAKGAEV